jgi:hypothetical protein
MATKFISVPNDRRAAYLYRMKTVGDKEFVANGEIGPVTGQMRYGKKRPYYTNVEFSGGLTATSHSAAPIFPKMGSPISSLLTR